MLNIYVFFSRYTLQGTNISRFQGTFEDDFPFPQVGYVNSLEGIALLVTLFSLLLKSDDFFVAFLMVL